MEGVFFEKYKAKQEEIRLRIVVYRERLKVKPAEKVTQERQLALLGHIYRMPERRQTRRLYETRRTGKYKRRSRIENSIQGSSMGRDIKTITRQKTIEENV